MKKVLITGALGFIGFHLTELLLNRGIEVVAVDARMDPRRELEYEAKELTFLRNSNYNQVSVLLQNESLEELGHGCDTIFHLSTPGEHRMRPQRRVEEGREVMKRVMQGSYGKLLIYLSSFEVYGKRYGSITERTPLHPVTHNGRVKAAEEAVLATAEEEMVIKKLRVPLVYGPWQPGNYVYQHYFLKGDLISTYKNEGEIFHYDALYVDDVCEGLYKVASRRELSETINLSSGREGEWQKGVEWCIEEQLNLEKEKTGQCAISTRECSKFSFKNLTSIQTGLEKQRQHVEMMKKLDAKIFNG
ncbi:NAD(P)-dependent oxidoreductase [Pseudalkalibacillus hwajinpoensis]|uniref:NAD-dependent epimerase/dehydratase family protein n=1 Tax=Guptibacillus hwajinpoensis TaxID=208199 RepID=UPI00325AAF06